MNGTLLKYLQEQEEEIWFFHSSFEIRCFNFLQFDTISVILADRRRVTEAFKLLSFQYNNS